MKNDIRLYKIFFIRVTIFIVSLILISFFTFYILTIRHTEKRVESDFHSEADLLAGEISHKVTLAIESVKALSSRTMIRNQLYSYHLDEITLGELQEYTQPKYIDGASVYSNIVAARRTAADGNIVAEFIKEEYHFPPVPEDADIRILQENGLYFLFIRNQIIYNDVVIGYDTVIFDFSRVLTVDTNYLSNLKLCNNANTKNQKNSTILFEPISECKCFLYAELNEDILLLEKKKTIKTVIFFSALLFVAVSFASYFTILRSTVSLLSEKDRTNKELEKLVGERGFLLKEMNHRVKNNLNLINSFISMQFDSSDSDELKAGYQELQAKISAISLVHRQLQNREDSMDIEIGSYLKELCQSVISINEASQVFLNIDRMEAIIVKSDKAIPIGLIFTELTTNSIKHAKVRDRLNINIDIRKTESSLILSYMDDGAPFPEDFSFDSGKSMGISLISNLSRQINAGIRYNFADSKKIDFDIPLG